MKYFFQFLFIILTLLIFQGCSYNASKLSPKFFKDEGIVYLDTYKVKNIINYERKLTSTNKSSNLFVGSIESKDVCKNISFIEVEVKNNYIHNLSSLNELLFQYHDSCLVEKIENNIAFVQCFDDYYIVSTNKKEMAYGSRIRLKVDKVCFKDLKKYFIKMNDNNKLVISDKRDDEKYIYKGKFKLDTGKNCPKEGIISVSTKDDFLRGYISYKVNEAKYTKTIKGSVVGNDIAGNIDRETKFYGEIHNNLIKGKYYNKQCKGTFKLKPKR